MKTQPAPGRTQAPAVFRLVGWLSNPLIILAFRGCVGFGSLFEELDRGGFLRGEFGGFGNVLDGSRRRHFGQQLNAAVVLETRASRDEAAHDDVFLQTAKVVDLAGNSGFGEYARGFLEARGRDKRVGRERLLGDTEEERSASCRAASILDHLIVLFAEAELVHLLFEEERSVANVFDLDPAHHLTRDGFDVLVVDVHTLEAVDLLNRVHEVSLGELFAENREQVVQVERTVDQSLTGLDVIAFLNVDVNTARNRIFLRGLAVFAFDVDLAHALGDIAVTNRAADFANEGRILGLAGFEEFDDARETTGNVFRLGGFTRDLREYVSGRHFIAVLDHQVGA